MTIDPGTLLGGTLLIIAIILHVAWERDRGNL